MIYYKNKFYELARKFEDVEAERSLYKYYGMLADKCHNSYYYEVVNGNNFDREVIFTSIVFLLTEFCKGLISEEI